MPSPRMTVRDGVLLTLLIVAWCLNLRCDIRPKDPGEQRKREVVVLESVEGDSEHDER